MQTHRLIIPAAILLALAVPAAHAETAKAGKPAAQPSSSLLSMDADKDGKISRAEWKGNAVSFQMLDRDGDGTLSGAELNAGATAPATGEAATTIAPSTAETATARQERRFKQLDANHDNRLTQAEWRGKPAEFQRLDRDHDGALTLQEMEGK